MSKQAPALKAEDIRVGHTYRGHRYMYGLGVSNDRTILWIGMKATHTKVATTPEERAPGGSFEGERHKIIYDRKLHVQYDSDTVRTGANYPFIPMERFLKWAKCEAPKEDQ
jgi:hypothetical protein